MREEENWRGRLEGKTGGERLGGEDGGESKGRFRKNKTKGDSQYKGQGEGAF